MPANSQSTTLVIFGASGDLTRRKLIPALYNHFKNGHLAGCDRIIGFARRPYDDEKFRQHLYAGLEERGDETAAEDSWEDFAGKLHYFQGDLGELEDFERLGRDLAELEAAPANRLYYLATAPEYYAPVVEGFKTAQLADESGGWRRIIVEKPFGHDLESARQLNQVIHTVFQEHQVYRIDHYLGKETAQNILVFRFANAIFEPVWNRHYIDHVQITVTESVDVGRRAGYYDQVGVLRDMFQNHLLQLLALVAMEPPVSMEAGAVRSERVKVLQNILPLDLADTVRAQYRGYHQVDRVAAGSQTPTYAALKLWIDNWRWKGVPFYLRSGKALARKSTEISIVFQRPPYRMLRLPGEHSFIPNVLSVCIQPDEGIHLSFQAKVPGLEKEMRAVDMNFHYHDSFERDLPDAYERLLLDALAGDPALFIHRDEIETSWDLVDPIQQAWEADSASPLAAYEPGSTGPEAADELLARDGRSWCEGCSALH